MIDQIQVYNGSEWEDVSDDSLPDFSKYIQMHLTNRKNKENINLVIIDDNRNEFTITKHLYKKNDIITDNDKNFITSLKKVFADVTNEKGLKLSQMSDIEKDYFVYSSIFNDTKKAESECYLKDNILTQKGLEYVKNNLYQGDFVILLFKPHDHKINSIILSDSYKYKKLRNPEELKNKIEDLLKKKCPLLTSEDVQNYISKSSEEKINEIEIKYDDDDEPEQYDLNNEINLEITNIDDSFLEDKKATIKFGIDDSKKSKLKIAEKIKDHIITFNDTNNEDTEIVNYITNTFSFDNTKYKVVKGKIPITNNEKLVDSETYTILFTDKVEGYVEEMKEDDIPISIEFKVNDSTKLKLNESNKTCDIVLNKNNCGIDEIFKQMSAKYDNFAANGVILSIKEDGNNTELLNNNTYKCKKNKKYIITLCKKINNLVEEKTAETPNKDKDKGKEKKDKEINNNNNTSLNKDDNNKKKKICKCC